MATNFIFNNRRVILPGAYSTIKSVVKNPPAQLDYGTICIIDTGSGATFGGGAGIQGTLSNGKDSVYIFDDIQQFRDYVKGGLWWLLSDPLFNPARGVNGVSRIYFVRACSTTPAEITFSPTGGGSAGGSLVLQCRDEGVIGNGVQSSINVLVKGYAGKLTSGTDDPNKFVFSLWRGTFKGVADDGIAYDGISLNETTPELLTKSPEFSNMSELIAWAENDIILNNLFHIKTKTITGTGAITSADLILYSGNILASGGVENYSAPNTLQDALDAVKDLPFTFFIADKWGDDAQGVQNTAILNHIYNSARFEKMMIVGGGADQTKFDQTNGSIQIAKYFNSDRVIVCHGAVKKKSISTGSGFRIFPSIYKAAVVLGRICGIAPQIPITFKNINIDGEVHPLNDKQKEKCLENGVLATYFDHDNGWFQILQGVNSLQKNNNLLNPDGTTFSIQLRRITSQINRELEINIKKELLSDPNGVNRNTLSEAYIRDWVIGYLQLKTATTTSDNLIISFRNVTVQRNQDAYFVQYEIEANTEITKVFVTGLLSV
mgnify:CR=1 FL=1